jgi:hypothetical protein
MKKKILMALVALMTGVCAQAQTEDFPRHEVAVSYGAGSNSQWLNALEHITTVMVTVGNVSYENESFTGPFSVEYFYHPKAWLGVGGIAVYGKNTQDVMSGSTKKGELTQAYYTLMPGVKFDWLRSNNFGMYSKFGVGATIRHETYDGNSESVLHFNWQASLLGMEVGARQIRAFVELGVGEQGIGLIGLRYKFN